LQSNSGLQIRNNLQSNSDLQSKTGLLRNDLLKNELLKLRKISLKMMTYMMSLIENKKDAELAERSKLRGINLHQP
jgi:hypothetical protein